MDFNPSGQLKSLRWQSQLVVDIIESHSSTHSTRHRTFLVPCFFQPWPRCSQAGVRHTQPYFNIPNTLQTTASHCSSVTSSSTPQQKCSFNFAAVLSNCLRREWVISHRVISTFVASAFLNIQMRTELKREEVLYILKNQLEEQAAQLQQQTARLLSVQAQLHQQTTMIAYIIHLVTTGNEGAGKTATSQPPNLGKLSTDPANEVFGSDTSFTTFSFQLP
jgi:hypothetical protein